MYEVIFLLTLGGAWILFASVQDLKTREVANWLNFSLIIFALSFRFFYSLFFYENTGFGFFSQGLLGLGIFFIIGNLFYYGRVFAGGDAKLMIALGPVLALSKTFFGNVKIFVLFFILFLFSGAIYGLIFSIILSARNFKKFKKEFFFQFNNNKKISFLFMLAGLLFMVSGMVYEKLLLIIGVFAFLFPYFYTYAKAVDEASMIKLTKIEKLTEGDWLYRDLVLPLNKKSKRKIIKARWDGLSKKDIEDIRRAYGKGKKIEIRNGIAFVPVFLISFLIFALIFYLGYSEILWNSFW